MTAPLLRVRDVWRVFREDDQPVEALRGVTAEIGGGEFVAIVGPSGSGKSTFMNVLGCLDRPTRGRYWLADRDVSELDGDAQAELRNREIGFVFQNFNLIPRMSALENVELPLFYGDVPLGEQTERARAALDAVGLAERAHHPPSQLSGGEQQRVAIARALVNRPRILLADEPTGNLDSHTTTEIMESLGRLHRERGITIALVTHDPEVAEFAERLLVFRDGRVAADVATPRARPAVAAPGVGA